MCEHMIMHCATLLMHFTIENISSERRRVGFLLFSIFYTLSHVCVCLNEHNKEARARIIFIFTE